jgi:hypothetical protein
MVAYMNEFLFMNLATINPAIALSVVEWERSRRIMVLGVIGSEEVSLRFLVPDHTVG